MKKSHLFITIVIILALSSLFLFSIQKNPSPISTLSAQSYFEQHLSEISPEKEVLGGKFYITSITENISPDRSTKYGEIHYEDGHIAFVAHYELTINPDGTLTLKKFEIVK